MDQPTAFLIDIMLPRLKIISKGGKEISKAWCHHIAAGVIVLEMNDLPTPFVETAAASLVELGHEPGRIKTERFGPTGEA